MELPGNNTYGMAQYLREIEDKCKKAGNLPTFQDERSIVSRGIFSESARPAWMLAAGISKILYQIRHVELQGKWGYKLHAKTRFLCSTQPINLKLTTTNSPMQPH